MTHENYEATLWELVDVTLFSVVLGDFCPAWGIYTYTYIYILCIYIHIKDTITSNRLRALGFWQRDEHGAKINMEY